MASGLTLRRGVLLGTLVLSVLGVAAQDLPMHGVRVPLEYYPDGGVKTQLLAGQADVPEEGDIFARDVRIEFLTADGEPDGFVTSPACTYKRKRGEVTSREALRIERGGVTITGRGFTWRTGEEKAKIWYNVRVVLPGSVKTRKKGTP